MRASAVVAVVATALLARTAAADGESPAATARAYYLAGQAAYQSGDYAAAALALEQAARALPDPRTTFSLAQAYRQLFLARHDPAYAARAVELYKDYLAHVPSGGRSDDAREFSASLGTLVELAAMRGGSAVGAKSIAAKTQLMVWSTLPGARAAIDGGAAAPMPVVSDVPAGPHQIDLAAEGYEPKHVDVVAADGQLVAVEGQLRAKPATLRVAAPSDARITIDGVDVVDQGQGIHVEPGPHHVWVGDCGRDAASADVDLLPGGEQRLALPLARSTRRRYADATLIASGVLAVGAAGVFGAALYDSHTAHELLTIRDTQAWTVAQAANYASTRAAALQWADVSLGIAAGAAAVAGVGLYLFYADVPEAPRRSTLTPIITPGGGGAALSGRF